MIELKMEVFLSEPELLRGGKDTFLHVVSSSFALAKLFTTMKDGFAKVN